MPFYQTVLLILLLISAIVTWGYALTIFLPNTLKSCLALAIVISLGIVALTLSGLLIAVCPLDKNATSFAVVAILTIFSIVKIKKSVGHSYSDSIKQWFSPLSLWALAAITATAITYIPVKEPPELFDGPYVFKTWTLPVQIQALCNDLPPDNAIPAVITEFLVRDIPFKKERPIMPGQEVSNRPILLSLAATPIRALFSGSPAYNSSLTRFDYVGTSWPDTLQLVTDKKFRLFLITGITLNASLIVGFYTLLSVMKVPYKAFASAIFFLLSPYALLHSLYTWPKNLAAFFLIVAILIICYKKVPIWTAGFILALAYWSHPYAIVFIGVASLYLLYMRARKTCTTRDIVYFFVTLVLTLLPWFIWTNLILNIPSDLVSQNFDSSRNIGSQIWARIYNTQTMIFPHFLGNYPFDRNGLVMGYFISLAAPLGLTLIFFTPAALVKLDHKPLFFITCVSGTLIVCAFARPAVPLLHGWQAVWPVLASATMLLFAQHDKKSLITLLIIQGVLNITFLSLWLTKVSV
jgi:hypothetical protein